MDLDVEEDVDMTAVLRDDLVLDALAAGAGELAVALSDGDPLVRLLAAWKEVLR